MLRDYLREKYRARRPDLILAFVSWSFKVAWGPPEELIPGVPVVFMAVNPTPVPVGGLGTNITGIVMELKEQALATTLARKLGDTAHVCGLVIQLARRSGAGSRLPDCLLKIAVERGDCLASGMVFDGDPGNKLVAPTPRAPDGVLAIVENPVVGVAA